MVRLLLAAFLALATGPVLAQDQPTVPELFAIFATGLADGAVVTISPTVKDGAVREPSPGIYEVSDAGKHRARFIFVETEPCVIKLSGKMTPSQPGHVVFDARQITGVSFEENGTQGALKGWRVKIAAPKGAGSVVNADGSQPLDDLTTTIYTSLSRDRMQQAADALRTRCSGAPTPPPSAPVDLLAAIFTGVAEGATVSLGNGGGNVVKHSDGLYTVEPVSSGNKLDLSITETGPCTFSFVINQDGMPEGHVTLDANLITDLSIHESGTQDGLTHYRVSMAGGEGMLTIQMGDEPPKAGTEDNFMTTSLTLDDVQAAIDTFRTQFCPGITQ
jgi:hypothetical protein